ncbi:VOC family protein [Bacteroidota bacterium]
MKKIYLITFPMLALALLIAGYTPMSSCTNKEKAEVKDSDESRYVDPGLKKMVQVAIVVKDIEASSKRWAELLGMPMPEIRTTRPGNEVDVIYRGKPSNGKVKLSFFALNDGMVLELLEPITEGTAWKEFLDEHGEGVQHLGFKFVDKEKAKEQFEKDGYPIIHEGRYDSQDGTYIYYDTEEALGATVELLHSDVSE